MTTNFIISLYDEDGVHESFLLSSDTETKESLCAKIDNLIDNVKEELEWAYTNEDLIQRIIKEWFNVIPTTTINIEY